MNAWADFYRAMAESRRAEARAVRLDPHYTTDECEKRGQLYDRLAADYDRMAAEEEAHA